MASNYGIVNDVKDHDHQHHHHIHHPHHHHHQVISPRTLRRSAPSSPSSVCSGQGGAPKCVCAPATHAGSFKCRLHRTNSHGPHSPPTAAAPTPPVSSTPSRTVEAQ